jgi:hypothetical protein
LTLVAMGVAKERLQLALTHAYSIHSRRIERHLVLTYRPAANSALQILDNLTPAIAEPLQRHDLGQLTMPPWLMAYQRALDLGSVRPGDMPARRHVTAVPDARSVDAP